ncbi:MAG: anthranilate synthase component I [Burkholderiaceae bacterium]|nr:anthranilate synthase component I [Burkholderiaceae bacterium]
MTQSIDLAQFRALARQGYNRIPVNRQLNADLDTPLSAYLKLAEGPYSFLLESVVGGERFGRYSFIGLPAQQLVRAFDRTIQTCAIKNGKPQRETELQGDPLAYLEGFMAGFRLAPVQGLPRFAGGLAGYFGYDTIRYIERRLDSQASKARPDPLGLPDLQLLLTESLAVFDNLAGRLSLFHFAAISPEPTDQELQQAFNKAQAELDAAVSRLKLPLMPPQESPAGKEGESRRGFQKADYLHAVARAKDYIAQGDVMQVVLAQLIERDYQGSPLTLYRALRALNPSPYMYFYDMGDFHIIGASPEILVRQDCEPGGPPRITIRPIAGTRPRGASQEQDLALEAELKADPKERAEHVMLIDLARNDVGRIAKTGSVRVNEQMVVERYSHVMHLVSDVEGELNDGLSAMDVLRASFPAGTLSGAPKIRAMEIIDELEPVKRGIYGGACGYWSFTGQMDLAIAIRTGILKDKTLYVSAGAGIVADSVPESEWKETETKARAVLHAAEIAERGLEP